MAAAAAWLIQSGYRLPWRIRCCTWRDSASRSLSCVFKLMRYFRPRTDWATEAAYALYVFVGLAWVYVGWWPKIRALMSG